MSLLIEDNAVVLFQGDSITDAERDRGQAESMGTGYAFMTAAWLNALYPEKGLRIFNRGIAGDRVQNLQERWQQDCLELQPSWLSILIGVNDTWATPVGEFAERYHALLEQTRANLPNTRLIICEPFFVMSPEHTPEWRERLDPKIHVVRRLAREYKTLFVPFDGLFAQVSTQRDPAFWAHDGVHPSAAGHALMAQAWLKAVRAI